MFGYIYESTDKRNGMLYIGKRVRATFDPNYRGSGTIVRRIIEKHGNDTFTTRIIDHAADKLFLDKLEKAYIAAYRLIYGVRGLYNLASGGEGGIGGDTFTNSPKKELTREKNRLAHLGVKRGPQSEEHKSRRRLALLGKKRGPHKKDCACISCRSKRGEVVKGPMSEEQKSKISKALSGKPKSQEHIEKNRLSHLGVRRVLQNA